jgi:hypothetical protein
MPRVARTLAQLAEMRAQRDACQACARAATGGQETSPDPSFRTEGGEANGRRRTAYNKAGGLKVSCASRLGETDRLNFRNHPF